MQARGTTKEHSGTEMSPHLAIQFSSNAVEAHRTNDAAARDRWLDQLIDEIGYWSDTLYYPPAAQGPSRSLALRTPKGRIVCYARRADPAFRAAKLWAALAPAVAR